MAARSTTIQGRIQEQRGDREADISIKQPGDPTAPIITVTIRHGPREAPSATRVVIDSKVEGKDGAGRALTAADLRLDLDAFVEYAAALVSLTHVRFPPGSTLVGKDPEGKKVEWDLEPGLHMPVLREEARVVIHRGRLISHGKESDADTWTLELENQKLTAFHEDLAELRRVERVHAGKRRKNGATALDLKTVARVYKRAVAAGEPPQRAVAQELFVSSATAWRRIHAARQAGLLPLPEKKQR